MDDLKLFMDNPPNNAWIYCMRYNLYVRKAWHALPDIGVAPCFDIANIHVAEKLRGKGNFADLLGNIELVLFDYPKVDYIYIENLHNIRFLEYLLRIGFKKSNGNGFGFSSSVYRKIER